MLFFFFAGRGGCFADFDEEIVNTFDMMRGFLLVLASAVAVTLAVEDLVGSDEVMELMPEDDETRTAQSQVAAGELVRGASSSYSHGHAQKASSVCPFLIIFD